MRHLLPGLCGVEGAVAGRVEVAGEEGEFGRVEGDGREAAQHRGHDRPDQVVLECRELKMRNGVWIRESKKIFIGIQISMPGSRYFSTQGSKD